MEQLFFSLVGLAALSSASGVFPETRVLPSTPQGPRFAVNGKEFPATIYYAGKISGAVPGRAVSAAGLAGRFGGMV